MCDKRPLLDDPCVDTPAKKKLLERTEKVLDVFANEMFKDVARMAILKYRSDKPLSVTVNKLRGGPGLEVVLRGEVYQKVPNKAENGDDKIETP